MSLTPQERANLQGKQREFKELLKKAELIIFIMQNLTPRKIRHVFQAINTYTARSVLLQQQMQNHYSRIGDCDPFKAELLQVFILRLLINMVLKCKSSKPESRLEALYCA